MKKILISGGNGFLGKSLKHRFSEDKFRFWTLGKADINHIKCDIVYNLPLLPKVDIVIHAAGKAHNLHGNNKSYQEFFNVNVQGTINLLKALQLSHLPKSFVFISTVAVYGKKEGFLISEDEPLLATDPYGQSKIQAEQIVQEWCIIHNVKFSILRLPLILGSDPPGNLGVMINGIKKGYYFNIGGGRAKKSMVLAEDVANQILKIAEIGGVYNLSDGYHPNFNELSRLIASQLGVRRIPNIPYFLAKLFAVVGDVLGKKSPFNSDRLKKITANLTFDDSKARSTFGWNPTPVLKGFKIK